MLGFVTDLDSCKLTTDVTDRVLSEICKTFAVCDKITVLFDFLTVKNNTKTGFSALEIPGCFNVRTGASEQQLADQNST